MSAIIDEFSESTEEQVELVLQSVLKSKHNPKKLKGKSKRCKDTIDWVEVEYGDGYKKPKNGESGY